MLSDEYKDIDNLNTYKNKIKKCKSKSCSSRSRKFYIINIGFVWEQKRNLEYSVALEVFLLLASIVFLQVYASFLTFHLKRDSNTSVGQFF